MTPKATRPWILVTGAAGLVASYFRRAAITQYNLFSVDCREVTALEGPGAEVTLRVDLGSAEGVHALWEALPYPIENCQAIVHCAAYYDFSNQDDEQYLRLEEGLRALLERFQQSAPKHCVFVYPSSMAALAPTRPGLKLRAESPKASLWRYPASKVRIEEILDAYTGPQAIVQLVLAGVYTDRCELVPLYQWIETIALRKLERTFYPASADRGLTYVHAEDVARAFLKAVHLAPGRKYRFLIGEPSAVTYRQIHRAVLEEVLGLRYWPLLWLPRSVVWLGARVLLWLQPGRFLQPWMIQFAGEHFEFDTTQAESGLGWKAEHSLAATLPKLLRLRQEHPQMWARSNGLRPWRKGECGSSGVPRNR